MGAFGISETIDAPLAESFGGSAFPDPLLSFGYDASFRGFVYFKNVLRILLRTPSGTDTAEPTMVHGESRRL